VVARFDVQSIWDLIAVKDFGKIVCEGEDTAVLFAHVNSDARQVSGRDGGDPFVNGLFFTFGNSSA